MDAALVLGVAALAVSVVALVVSATLAARQVRLLRDANHLPAIVDLFSEFRNVALHNDFYYVTEQLRKEHDPQLGLSGLPEPAKSAAYNVAYYFNTLALMVGFGVFDDRRLFVTAIRQRIVSAWGALKPYVLAERSLHGFQALIMLETLSQLAETSTVRKARFWREHRLLRTVSQASRGSRGEPEAVATFPIKRPDHDRHETP